MICPLSVNVGLSTYLCARLRRAYLIDGKAKLVYADYNSL